MLSSLPLPLGDIGTIFTLYMMRGMIAKDFMLPMVRLTATNIVAGLGGVNGTEQAHAIRDWLEDHTEFLRDPDGVEMLHGPAWQLQQIAKNGRVYVDCDDVAMLSAALGKAVGLRARFVVVGFDSPHAPYKHVWTELTGRQVLQWVDMDITRPSQGLPFNRIRRVLPMNV